MQLRAGHSCADNRKASNQSDVVFGGHEASDRAHPKGREGSVWMRRVRCEFLDVDAIVDDRGVASRKPVPGNVKIAHAFRNKDQRVNPAYGVAPNPFTVGVPVVISTVAGVDDDWNSGKDCGCDGVV